MSEVTTNTPRQYVLHREAKDPWVHSENSAGWDGRYEQLTPVAFHGQFTGAWLDQVQIFLEQVNSPYSFKGRPWKGSRVFFSCFPETGRLYCDKRFLTGDSFATHRWDSLDRMWCSGSFKAVYVVVDEEFFQQHTERLLGKRYFRDQNDAVVINTDPFVGNKFRTGAMQVLQDLAAAPEALKNEPLRRGFQDRLLGLLIDALEASNESSSRLPPPTTRAYVVDKAMQFVEPRLAEPIGLADMCEAVRVSPRTLRYSFEEILGLSPMRYLLSRRLNQVRRELSTCAHQPIIEEIAVRWGFWHMGRFAQFYRESFGERPSDTRRRADTAAVARSSSTSPRSRQRS